MRCTERTDVRALRIGAGIELQSDAADLTSEVIDRINPLRNACVANDSKYSRYRAVGLISPGRRRRVRILQLTAELLAPVESFEPESADDGSIDAWFLPMVGDGVETVVAIAVCRRILRIAFPAADNANRKTLFLYRTRARLPLSSKLWSLICFLVSGSRPPCPV